MIDASYWDTAPEGFITDDRANPARAAAAGIVAGLAIEHGSLSLVEVGPGPGFDYEDFWHPLVDGGLVHRYDAIEASLGMRDRFHARHPEANVVLGGFEALYPAGQGSTGLCPQWDVAYTKATLEHQEDFRGPLVYLLGCARWLVIVNFYLPPGDKAELRYDERQKVHYNCYAAADVARFLRDRGLTFWIHHVPGSTNVLYLIEGCE